MFVLFNTITNVPGLVFVVPVTQRKKSYDLIIIIVILINVDYVEEVVVVC